MKKIYDNICIVAIVLTVGLIVILSIAGVIRPRSDSYAKIKMPDGEVVSGKVVSSQKPNRNTIRLTLDDGRSYETDISNVVIYDIEE